MSIGKQLRQLRESKGLNKKELTLNLDIPYSTYNNWETDAREPNSKYLKLFSEYYDVSIDYILGIQEKPLPPTKGVTTLAAHHSGIEWTAEERADIEWFIDRLLEKRKSEKP